MAEQAFALLIEPHRRALHLHCYRMLGSLHDADDALQETMLRAWKGSGRYEPRAQHCTWLHAIATNVCLTAIARRRARPAELTEDLDGLVALLTDDALMTMPPERMRIAGARAIGDFFGSVPNDGRLDEIRLVPTSANRQPALAAYAPGDGGKHLPYGLMVFQIEGGLISGIVGFPDPWLFEQCGLPSELQ